MSVPARGKRLALVIGVAAYRDLPPLKAPVNDAKAFAAVLRDPHIGAYAVDRPRNQGHGTVRERIEEFFADRSPDDTLILYFSGHGLRDARRDRELYLGVRDTKKDRLGSTAISKSFIEQQIQDCDAGRIILFLDCCYAGVATSKGQEEVREAFQALDDLELAGGRMVIAACGPSQTIDEGRTRGKRSLSPFTEAAVEGLRSGAADLNGDGKITGQELFEYIRRELVQSALHGRLHGQPLPEFKLTGQGDLLLAWNPNVRVSPTDRRASSTPPSGSTGRLRRPRRWFLRTGGTAIAATGAALLVSRALPLTELTVVSSPEKLAILRQLADQYNRRRRWPGLRRVSVRVEGPPAGGTIDALVKGRSSPDVWASASSLGLRLLMDLQPKLSAGLRLPTTPPQAIASSPLVIALPRGTAESLGWPDFGLDWTGLIELATARDWAALERLEPKRPQRSPFQLAKTQPTTSTCGLGVTLATYMVAAGRPVPDFLSLSDMQKQEVRRKVREVEHSVTLYSETTLTFLAEVQRQPDERAALDYLSAIVLEEQTLWAFNHGSPTGQPEEIDKHLSKPRVPLAAFYPTGGTFFSDHPYIVLTADPDRQEAADEFLDYLQQEASQEVFQRYGFRNWLGKLGEGITDADGVLPDKQVNRFSTPGAGVIRRLVVDWPKMRKAARALLVLDVSGSMAAKLGERQSKLDQAKEATVPLAEELFGAIDQAGLWVFPSGLARGGEQDYRELAQVAPVDGQHRERLLQYIRGLKVESGQGRTGLYATVRAAVAHMRKDYDTDRVNAVVVVTAGIDDGAHPPTLDELVGYLRADGGMRVRVFAIGYALTGGDKVDNARQALQRIARDSQGVYLDAPTPDQLRNRLAEAIESLSVVR